MAPSNLHIVRWCQYNVIREGRRALAFLRATLYRWHLSEVFRR